MASTTPSVKCLILKVDNYSIVVPNTVVAEVLHHESMTAPAEGTPKWLLGRIDRPDQSDMPVLSFSVLCADSTAPTADGSRVVALHSLAPEGGVRQFGLAITGVPSFEFIDSSKMSSDGDGSDESEFIARRVFVNGLPCVVPDLDALAVVVNQQNS